MQAYRWLGTVGIVAVIAATAMFWPGEPESGLPAVIVLQVTEVSPSLPEPSPPAGLTVVRPAPVDLDDLDGDEAIEFGAEPGADAPPALSPSSPGGQDSDRDRSPRGADDDERDDDPDDDERDDERDDDAEDDDAEDDADDDDAEDDDD